MACPVPARLVDLPAMTSGTTALEGSVQTSGSGPVTAMPRYGEILGRPKEPVPGLGTEFKPIVMPKRVVIWWPVAHRPGRPAMSRTATRQAWPCGNQVMGPQPADRQSSRRSHGVAAAPAGLASSEMVGYEGARPGWPRNVEIPPQLGYVQAGYRSESFRNRAIGLAVH